MENKVMYMSSDKAYLLNNEGSRLAERVVSGTNNYYRTIGIESEAYNNTCTETRLLIVCTLWDVDQKCLKWDKVNMCTKSKLVPKAIVI